MPPRRIGGFFELETGTRDEPPHAGALALSNGRACLYVILDEVRPRRVFLPFYCCDAVLAPFTALKIEIEFYAVDDAFDPLRLPDLQPAEMFLYVNYFGLKRCTASTIAARYGQQAIVDDTHGFYEPAYDGAWSFNSARKFFGVPDGAYLYAPYRLQRQFSANRNIRTEHLVAELIGREDEAYLLYRQSEDAQQTTPYQMTALTRRLLAGVDHPGVRECRAHNFDLYNQALGPLNRLRLAIAAEQAPFCYPFLPERSIDHVGFHRCGIFIPRLWKEVVERHADGFDWERCLAQGLLPLPVDHRLTGDDVANVIGEVRALLDRPNQPT